MSDLPTVRDFAGTSGIYLVVWCKACRHQETVAFAKLAEAAKATRPWLSCGSVARCADQG